MCPAAPQDDEAEPDGGTVGGGPPTLAETLRRLGATDVQISYVETCLHPLVLSMVVEAVKNMPEDPTAFFLNWFLQQLNAPQSVWIAVSEWQCGGCPDMDARSAAPSEDGEASEASEVHDTGCSGILPSIGAIVGVEAVRNSRQELTVTMPPDDNLPKRPRPSFAGVHPSGLPSGEVTPRNSTKNSTTGYRKRPSTCRVMDVPLATIKETLATVPVLGSLSDEDRNQVASVSVVRHYDAQADIIHHGELTSELLVVMSGSCRVSVPEYKRTLKVGDCFNEVVALLGETTSDEILTAAPSSDVQLLSVNIKELKEMGFWKKCARSIRATSSHLIGPSSHLIGHEGENNPRQMRSQRSRIFDEPSRERELAVSPLMYEKSEQDLEMIRMAVSRNQLTELMQLSEEQIEEIALRMTREEYDANDVIIRQGDLAEHFFVMHSGVAELINNPDPENPQRNLPGNHRRIQFWSGSSFGELALLYNCNRTATIVAVQKTVVWMLDLSGWRYVLEKTPVSRLEDYSSMLAAVPILNDKLETVEKRRTLADCLDEVFYQRGEFLVEAGSNGFTLFFVYEGTCTTRCEGEEPRTLRKGDFFGEEAWLQGEPYPYSVVVSSDHASILQLDREVCRHLNLGIEFEGGGAQSSPRRQSLLHLATTSVSNTQLAKLGSARQDVPLERLQFVGVLGAGSFAQVSLVHDPEADTLYALKAMSKQAIINQSLQQVVNTERNTMLELVQSPFVVRLITTYKDAACIYMLTEPALGGELFVLYQDKEWYGDQTKAWFYTCCVSIGIDFIHSKKIIHRDIKLENVLLDSKGYPKIADLGISKVVIGKTYTVCGTADYLAPETLKQAGHNRAVDWWALGIMLYVMQSGRMPFDAENVLQIYKNIVKGFKKEHFLNKPEDFVNFVKALCKKKPQERLPMLPGGLKNVATHSWVSPDTELKTWNSIYRRQYSAPWEPDELTLEERRASMKQAHDSAKFEPVGQVSEDEWDSLF
eukprot:CAMPEP_0206423258 /NCGR_PEP_ID=MMETSP0324_2-20121206/2583_1 /ASSEMBLY_ACC=CAM_ASM_000836 /TAXON_ID=2866 /ORGANISM="Crypthecodinium cohnii, Strain Seligo" /LENGTH=989 /DNA_ID=CAMNT_0053887803 /DNA_START=60 /DNA_END=3029 /DNA_ORIENTATION=-